MIRLFVPSPLSADAGVALDRDQSHYLTNVMRQAVGATLAVFNGRDGEWSAVIEQAGKRGVLLRATECIRAQTVTPDLDLVVAVVKRSRLETIVEKATELGCRRIRLVLTERTNAERIRIERLTAIAIEAAEQTGRLDAPEVIEPVKLAKLLDEWEPKRQLLFCDEGGDAKPVIQAVEGLGGQPWAVLIGPEGGFSPTERGRLRTAEFVVPATLGPRILRADTAAISALTLWQAAAGDWRT
ncbi:MAG: rRNA ((1498)-N(3))-methyltransferase [Caulobacteraceae bacterium]|nr:rRNA ((1498)-N(3))-methyltransferase [Caulobacteraceae bacterium]